MTPPQRSPVSLPPHAHQRAAAQLQRHFPGVVVWYGVSTANWWAMTTDGLIEAASVEELSRILTRRAMPAMNAPPPARVIARRPARQIRPAARPHRPPRARWAVPLRG
ncbi:hypothetical protein [Marinitenerispora sediminis]|uniref:Uncharacterized protein n=1 Tax=Marinitenerispora sediminis TaxID=1931232 RepID=A0A368T511_9ACTN|nr:hypothetical protein [Marinitenerispora sediminis]RCV57270.1 hypothetical protein DEF28_01935 [Marinitenerispora sediminis]RCV58268.1 hypothetical protein DEF23_09280 [Marinitenerispora sediminis]RCV58490.1 hypothetical protein DEF24_13315 [Marinitenerispora sediminis]